MDSLFGIAAILIGLATAGFGIYRLMHSSDAIRALKTESEGLATKVRAEVLQLEQFLETLSQRQEERKKALTDASDKLKETLSLLSPEEREERPPIYIAQDRRNKGDIEYRGTVTCSRLSGDWQRGREYVVWGKDDESARRALETKFPPSVGYVIENVAKSRTPF
jgi:hypothetical protein